jgi:hypothetical protein
MGSGRPDRTIREAQAAKLMGHAVLPLRGRIVVLDERTVASRDGVTIARLPFPTGSPAAPNVARGARHAERGACTGRPCYTTRARPQARW